VFAAPHCVTVLRCLQTRAKLDPKIMLPNNDMRSRVAEFRTVRTQSCSEPLAHLYFQLFL
jgi:hypothetical protein